MSAKLQVISEECSAIAFYGVDASARAAESFYRTVVKWFTDLDYPPDKIGITRTGHLGKLEPFTRGSAKLEKTGLENVIAMEIISSTPNALTGHGYFLEASYDGDTDGSYVNVVARSSLATLSRASMIPIARTLGQSLKPDYGIGYRMEHRNGPEVYVLGMGYGGEILKGEAYEEARNMARWGDVAMPRQLYRQGLLRDVYPWNFLTQPQLTRPVGAMSLEQWIHQDARRGQLSILCDGMFLWEVVESSIPDIRKSLREADVIFDWRKHG